eukprot:SAG31_NODE_125_length_23649_cov_7.156202_17_plen_444_part_00
MTASSSPLALLPLLLSLQQLPPSIAQGGEHDGARHKPGTPLSPPSQHFWRNDSANLALAAAWNRYYAATPYSWDVGSDSVGGGDPAISDDPPFSLEWSIGRDAPIAQKDGHGCLFRNRYFAIANGIWCYVDTPVAPDWNGTHASPCVQGAMAMAYDLHRHTWSHLPAPPTGAGRTTGACGSDSLYILSGMGGGGSVSQLTMSVDSRSEPVWSWRLLPELPRAATRWLGAAGVVDGHLVLAGGTNTRGFEFEAGARDLLHAKVAAQKPCDNATHCPPWLPSYRLYLQGAAPSHQSLNARWEEITKFPGGGMDVPNSAVVNGSLYMFGGWRANYAGMQAWQERGDSLYQLGLPVPLTLGTNGAQLLRYAYKYTVATNKWERLPDVPQHVCQGATAVLRSRYIVQIGSAHGHNSFRVGSTSTLGKGCYFLVFVPTVREIRDFYREM